MTTTLNRIRRAEAILSMAANLEEQFTCFMVLMGTGPRQGTATTAHGAAMAIGLPFDLIDGTKPVPATREPKVLMAIFQDTPSAIAMKELATSATAAAPGSLIVASIPDADAQAVRELRDAVAEVPSVLASNCSF